MDSLGERNLIDEVTRNLGYMVARYAPNANGKNSFIYVNDVFSDVFGVSKTSIYEGAFWELLKPRDAMAVREHFDNALLNASNISIRFQLDRPGGKSRYFQVSGRPSENFKKVPSIDLVFSDISDRWQNFENEMRPDNGLSLEPVLDTIDSVLIRIKHFDGGKREILFTSKGFWGSFGMDEKDGSLQSLFSLVDCAHLQEVEATVDTALKTRTQCEASYPVILSNGTHKWLRSSAIPTKIENDYIIWDIVTIDITHQMQAQRDAEMGSKLFQSTLDGMINSFYLLEPQFNKQQQLVDFTFKKVNQKACAELNMSEDEFIGRGINELFPINTENGFFNDYVRVYESGQRLEREYEVPGKFVASGWYYQQVVKTESGIAIHNIDISKRKQNELELLKNKDQLQTLVDELNYQKFALDQHCIVAMTDVKGAITYVNHKFEAITGYAKEDLIGKNHRLLKSGEHDRSFYREMFKVIGNGAAWNSDIKNRSKDGSCYWLNMTVVPYVDAENRKPSRYISISTDISAEKKYHKLLQDANLRFEKALQASKDAIWDWDIVNDEIFYGRGYEEIFGLSSEELGTFDKSVNRLHPDDRDRVLDKFNQAVNDAQTLEWSDLYRMRTNSGEYLNIKDRAVLVRDEKGKAVRMIGSAADITKMTAYLKSIEKQNKKLREIAWIQSHYLRAPLANSKGLIDMLLEYLPEEGGHIEVLDALKKSMNDLDEIIHEIVAHAESMNDDGNLEPPAP